MSVRLLHGDCREVLRTLPDDSVHCVVCSPPYFGLRDYGIAGQIGLEATPDAYVAEIVAVFREVRRVLRNDGTLWLNLGDSYAGSTGNTKSGLARLSERLDGVKRNDQGWATVRGDMHHAKRPDVLGSNGLKPKDLIGIPWMVAFALRADGWYLRQDIIWSKPNPMPESVRDRCCKSHEYLFLLSKSPRYFFDAAAIAEQANSFGRQHTTGVQPPKVIALKENGHHGAGGDLSINYERETRNRRSVWEVATQPFPGSHFATFPPALIEPCIKAGCPAKACAKCGKPWVREVELGGLVSSGPNQLVIKPRSVNRNPNATALAERPKDGYGDLPKRERLTLGFSPSCSCAAGTVPGTCLDPFSGAGTTGLVADRLGRNAILIELNEDYSGMSRRRIHDDAPLFAEVLA